MREREPEAQGRRERERDAPDDRVLIAESELGVARPAPIVPVRLGRRHVAGEDDLHAPHAREDELLLEPQELLGAWVHVARRRPGSDVCGEERGGLGRGGRGGRGEVRWRRGGEGAGRGEVLVEGRAAVDDRVARVEVDRVERHEEEVAAGRLDRVVAAASERVEEVFGDDVLPDVEQAARHLVGCSGETARVRTSSCSWRRAREKGRTAWEHDVVRVDVVCGGKDVSSRRRKRSEAEGRTVADARDDGHILAERLAHPLDDVLVELEDLGQRARQARVDVCEAARAQVSEGVARGLDSRARSTHRAVHCRPSRRQSRPRP